MAALHESCLKSTEETTQAAISKLDDYLSEFKKELHANKTSIETIMEAFPEKSKTIQYIDEKTADEMFKSCSCYGKMSKDFIEYIKLEVGEFIIFGYIFIDKQYHGQHGAELILTNLGNVFTKVIKTETVHYKTSEKICYDKHNKSTSFIPKNFNIELLHDTCNNVEEIASKLKPHSGNILYTSTPVVKSIKLILHTIKNCSLDAAEIYESETAKVKAKEVELDAEKLKLKEMEISLTKKIKDQEEELKEKLAEASEKNNLLDSKLLEVKQMQDDFQTKKSKLLEMKKRLDVRESGLDMRESLESMKEQLLKLTDDMLKSTDMFDYDQLAPKKLPNPSRIN